MSRLKSSYTLKLLVAILCLQFGACTSQPKVSQIEISIQALNRDASLAISKGDYIKAQANAKTAYEKAGKYNYYEQRLYAMMHLGLIAYYTGSLDLAKAYFQEIEKLLTLKEAKEPEIHFLNLIYLSEVIFALNKQSQASALPNELFSYLEYAENKLEKLNLNKDINTAKLKRLKIQIFIHQKKYKEAQSKISQLQEIYENLDDKVGLAQVEGYLAQILIRNDKHSSALSHLEKALSLSKEMNHVSDTAFFLAQSSKLKKRLAEKESSLAKKKQFLEQASWDRLQCVEMNKGLHNMSRLTKDYVFLANLYAKLSQLDNKKSYKRDYLTYKKLAEKLQKELGK